MNINGIEIHVFEYLIGFVGVFAVIGFFIHACEKYDTLGSIVSMVFEFFFMGILAILTLLSIAAIISLPLVVMQILAS